MFQRFRPDKNVRICVALNRTKAVALLRAVQSGFAAQVVRSHCGAKRLWTARSRATAFVRL